MTGILRDTEEFMIRGRQLEQVGFPFDASDPKGLRQLRIRLLSEEFYEYMEAEADNDLTEIVDGLIDVIVIAWGTLLSYVGPQAAEACAMEVGTSNLKKVVGEGLPKFREDGKIIKPEDWEPPRIADTLRAFGFGNV